MANKTHVVCTWYKNEKGEIITHAYGPKTKSKAQREVREMKLDHAGEIRNGTFHVSANKLIDL